MINDLKKLKEDYGEKFAHFCRDNFPSLLEQGELYNVISSCFAPNKFLYADLNECQNLNAFKSYIFSKSKIEQTFGFCEVLKTPEELMRKEGYILKKCKTVEDVKDYEKYYAKGELLCTFNDIAGRLKNYDIFFAVKENVDEIKRSDFKNPRRQDEYGTSVISLQFSRTGPNCSLSIKNRYNHSVDHPDNTFSNDLENICAGLTDSFKQHYGIDLSASNFDFSMDDGYVFAGDGRYYKYNYEINNMYYCINNVLIINSKPVKLDPCRYEILDYFVLDKQNKCEVIDYGVHYDSFSEELKNIEKIEIVKTGESGNRLFKLHIKDGKPIEIIVNAKSQMIAYKNPNVVIVSTYFLYFNRYLEVLDLPNARTLCDYTLYSCKNLRKANLPKVHKIENCVLYKNSKLKELNVPELYSIGGYFLNSNDEMSALWLPQVEIIDECFLNDNEKLKVLEAPNLRVIGSDFLYDNKFLKSFSATRLERIPDGFLCNNIELEFLDVPNVETIGHWVLMKNEKLTRFDAKKLISSGSGLLKYNNQLKSFNAPNMISIGDESFENAKFTEFVAPNLLAIGRDFMISDVDSLVKFDAPNLKSVYTYVLYNNKSLKYFNAPMLESFEWNFLYDHSGEFEYINSPKFKKRFSKVHKKTETEPSLEIE